MIDVNDLVLALIAIVGVMSGPFLAYLSTKRKETARLLHDDLEAVKGWSEQRKLFETEIAKLHKDLMLERDRRREERDEYQKQIDTITAELAEIRKRLKDCIDE